MLSLQFPPIKTHGLPVFAVLTSQSFPKHIPHIFQPENPKLKVSQGIIPTQNGLENLSQ